MNLISRIDDLYIPFIWSIRATKSTQMGMGQSEGCSSPLTSEPRTVVSGYLCALALAQRYPLTTVRGSEVSGDDLGLVCSNLSRGDLGEDAAHHERR